MKQFLSRVARDIWRGRDIDAYLAIGVALFAAAVQPFGWVDGAAYISISLTMFGLLGASLLISRHRLDALADAIIPVEMFRFLKEFDDGVYESDLEHADELWFYGASLGGLANERFAMLERKLRAGCEMRVLVIDPTADDVLAISEKRAYGNPSIDRARSKVLATLDDFVKMRDQTQGNLRLRTIKYPIPHRIVAVNPSTTSGRLYISEYLFQTPGGSVPRFVLGSRHDYWYNLYLTEAKSLWSHGEDWPPSPAMPAKRRSRPISST